MCGLSGFEVYGLQGVRLKGMLKLRIQMESLLLGIEMCTCAHKRSAKWGHLADP